LIVATLSLISNWTSQIEAHLEPSTLKVYVFHGPAKSDPKLDLDNYDVVVTSYQTLLAEYNRIGIDFKNNTHGRVPKTPRGLFGRLWRRLVLDEAHTIRNPESKTTFAVSSILAITRWSLTGTPIINELKDLYSQVRFLGIQGGLSDWSVFNRLITRPLKSGDPTAIRLLQALMSGSSLRRRKDMKLQGKPVIELPGVDEYVHMIGTFFILSSNRRLHPRGKREVYVIGEAGFGYVGKT
jgi:SWI/SNF-related matrix-associated actin-dependent regulator of chromatin subfamily A3